MDGLGVSCVRCFLSIILIISEVIRYFNARYSNQGRTYMYGRRPGCVFGRGWVWRGVVGRSMREGLCGVYSTPEFFSGRLFYPTPFNDLARMGMEVSDMVGVGGWVVYRR